MSQVFVPTGVKFNAVGIDGYSPTISFRDQLASKDSLVVFQSRAAMLELSIALLAALQDYDVTLIDGEADQVNYATDRVDYGTERLRSAERNA